MCFSPFLWPKTFSQAAREPHVGASDYPRRVAPYFHFAMTDRYARRSAFAEAGPNPAKPPQRSSPTAARAMDPRCAWLDPGANESKPPSGGFFGRANRQDDRMTLCAQTCSTTRLDMARRQRHPPSLWRRLGAVSCAGERARSLQEDS
jgi:hypothetical protein